jgi:mannose-1-phosphate guanylyltransferase
MKKNRYIVILAGGKGERLWPLSRQKRPKQLLPFCYDLSLLEQTINRIAQLVKKEHLWIVTTQEQEKQINQLVGQQVGQIVAEPASRNTAPAILLTCLEIAQKDENAIVSFLPADHFITQDDIFQENLKTAFEYSTQHDVITLLGLKPEWAATGYGYIEFEKNDKTVMQPQKIVRFHEKPSAATAQMYLMLPNMLWNIGVFCAKISVFLKEYEYAVPSLLSTMEDYLVGKKSYEQCDNISIDHAVMEKSRSIYVLPVSFIWSDVGNLDTFISLHTKHKETAPNTISINAQNNVLNVKDKLVALIGVENLCIVQTDDVLLIAQRDQTDKVKQVISLLKDKKNEDYL